MRRETWEAIRTLAEVWRKCPVVDRYTSPLRAASAPSANALVRHLQEIFAGYGAFAAYPLRQALLLGMLPDFDSGVPGASDFIDDGRNVLAAHIATVAWIRSRLPGYPQLYVPHLASGTTLTTTDFTFDLPWHRTHLLAGLQFESHPVGVEDRLGCSPVDLRPAAVKLGAALAKEESWLRFREARGNLNPQALTEVRAARKSVKQRLRPSEVDAFEPGLILPRDALRRRLLAEEIETLAGYARLYVDAFSAVDELIALVADSVFSELVTYGAVARIPNVESVVVEPGGNAISFETTGSVRLLRLGQLVLLAHPLIQDCIRVESIGWHFQEEEVFAIPEGIGVRVEAGTEIVRVRGTILRDSAGVFEEVAGEIVR